MNVYDMDSDWDDHANSSRRLRPPSHRHTPHTNEVTESDTAARLPLGSLLSTLKRLVSGNALRDVARHGREESTPSTCCSESSRITDTHPQLRHLLVHTGYNAVATRYRTRTDPRYSRRHRRHARAGAAGHSGNERVSTSIAPPLHTRSSRDFAELPPPVSRLPHTSRDTASGTNAVSRPDSRATDASPPSLYEGRHHSLGKMDTRVTESGTTDVAHVGDAPLANAADDDDKVVQLAAHVWYEPPYSAVPHATSRGWESDSSDVESDSELSRHTSRSASAREMSSRCNSYGSLLWREEGVARQASDQDFTTALGWLMYDKGSDVSTTHRDGDAARGEWGQVPSTPHDTIGAHVSDVVHDGLPWQSVPSLAAQPTHDAVLGGGVRDVVVSDSHASVRAEAVAAQPALGTTVGRVSSPSTVSEVRPGSALSLRHASLLRSQRRLHRRVSFVDV